jgi:hypothetical protein
MLMGKLLVTVWISKQVPNFIIPLFRSSYYSKSDDLENIVKRRQWNKLLEPNNLEKVTELFLHLESGKVHVLIESELTRFVTVYTLGSFTKSIIFVLVLEIIFIIPNLRKKSWNNLYNSLNIYLIRFTILGLVLTQRNFLYASMIFELLEIIDIPPIRAFIDNLINFWIKVIVDLIKIRDYLIDIISIMLFIYLIFPQLDFKLSEVVIGMTALTNLFDFRRNFILMWFVIFGVCSAYSHHHLIVLGLILNFGLSIITMLKNPQNNINFTSPFNIIEDYPKIL